MSVLIVTWTGENSSVDHVTRLLTERGVEVVRLDTDLYPQEVRLSTEYGSRVERRSRHLDRVEAVWYRRFRAANRLSASLGDTREACYNESRQTLWGSIVSLPCFQLDPLPAVRLADYKELQTRWALEEGLEVPRTLFSNDPDSVRQFYRELDGRVVTKMQSQFAIYRGGEERVVFTSRVKPEHLDKLSGLEHCPMIFQELVERKLELRTTVVGDRLFTSAIDASQAPEVDWRRDGVGLIDSWEPYELPPATAQALLRLASRFGLNYAAADFMVTPEGRHVFLEINAAGEWFWLQRIHPIAEAVAEVLAEPGRRRVKNILPSAGP